MPEGISTVNPADRVDQPSAILDPNNILNNGIHIDGVDLTATVDGRLPIFNTPTNGGVDGQIFGHKASGEWNAGGMNINLDLNDNNQVDQDDLKINVESNNSVKIEQDGVNIFQGTVYENDIIAGNIDVDKDGDFDIWGRLNLANGKIALGDTETNFNDPNKIEGLLLKGSDGNLVLSMDGDGDRIVFEKQDVVENIPLSGAEAAINWLKTADGNIELYKGVDSQDDDAKILTYDPITDKLVTGNLVVPPPEEVQPPAQKPEIKPPPSRPAEDVNEDIKNQKSSTLAAPLSNPEDDLDSIRTAPRELAKKEPAEWFQAEDSKMIRSEFEEKDEELAVSPVVESYMDRLKRIQADNGHDKVAEAAEIERQSRAVQIVNKLNQIKHRQAA